MTLLTLTFLTIAAALGALSTSLLHRRLKRCEEMIERLRVDKGRPYYGFEQLKPLIADTASQAVK
jgi:hypothetical protein